MSNVQIEYEPNSFPAEHERLRSKPNTNRIIVNIVRQKVDEGQTVEAVLMRG